MNDIGLAELELKFKANPEAPDFEAQLSSCNIRGQKLLGLFTQKVELMKLPDSFEVSDLDITSPRLPLSDAALKDERLRYISTLSDRQILQWHQFKKEELKTMSLEQLTAFFAQSEH